MTKSNDFVHLHLHTQYSLLDGAVLIGDLMQKIKETGMTPMVGISDHGTMHGIVDFLSSGTCKRHKADFGL